MKFTKLSVENYKSFQFATDIYFPQHANGNSIFLIGGMNGAGKTSIMEAINYCLYGCKVDHIYKNINRKEKARDNTSVSFELSIEMDDGAELIVKRSWSAGTITDAKAKDLQEKLVVVMDGKRVSVQNQQMWQDFIRATIPPGITQFFFFDGEKIQEIAADDHSEVRLKASLEAALGIQYISQLSNDILYIKQEERKNFVEISDADLEFKQSELKREQSKLQQKTQERNELKDELDAFKSQHDEAKKRFQATFHSEPESRDKLRQSEKLRIQAANRLTQVENEIKTLAEQNLPFSIVGALFGSIRQRIEQEREIEQQQAIYDNAAALAEKLVHAVEQPTPIYQEKLSLAKMQELEQRFLHLLQQGHSVSDSSRLLNLSERDAARVLQKMESLENSAVFLIKPLLEEKQELVAQIKELEAALLQGSGSESERELFENLQTEMEGCLTQIGRKTEQLRLLEDEILKLEKRIQDLQQDIEKLYEKHHVSKEKADFIAECDAIAKLLNQYTVRLRKNKVHLLQDKTFEMYQRLSSKRDLIKDILVDEASYEIKIIDRNGHEIKKSSLSAGEKEVFALSLLWGLAQTSQLKLPILIDTPLSRLDSSHRDSIIQHYFPNAGEQVIILSTDTEIDKDYYRTLQPYLSGAASLQFDPRQELTLFKQGYFWE